MRQLNLMAIHRAGGLLAAIVLAASLAACSPSETQEQRLARAESLSEVVEAVIHKAPAKAYTVAETRYLAVITEHANITRDYPLLKAKELMPVLLERYPEIDRFFLAWTNNGSQFLKVEFERSNVQNVRWPILSVKSGDVQKVASMYWAVPALR